MSFLSSLAKSASAAAASVSSMVSGSNLPFETGAEYTSVRDKMPWKMQHWRQQLKPPLMRPMATL